MNNVGGLDGVDGSTFWLVVNMVLMTNNWSPIYGYMQNEDLANGFEKDASGFGIGTGIE